MVAVDKASAFVCSHGYAFSEWEMEMGMTYATLAHLMEQNERVHNHESDLARELELAREYALDAHDCPWPWYADPAVDVIEPEVLPYEAGLWCAP